MAELPDSPGAQVSAGSIAGDVVDRDGDSVAGARVVLSRESQAAVETRTSADGRFSFPNLVPGAFRLTVTASGFALQQVSGVLKPGESVEVAPVSLAASSSTNVEVMATQADIAEAQIGDEEKQRVLGAIPNFYVSYIPHPVALAPKQKFELAYRTLVDPATFIITGVVAGIQQATNAYAGYGQGAAGYGKRYAAGYGNVLTSTLIGNAILPVLFKQDPRYFYKGTGTTRSRVLYAIANAVICKGDNMRWQPNYSAILGGLASAGISNAYYPAANRQGASLTFENAAIGIGGSAGSNLFQEFLIRKLTRHVPKPGPALP